MVCRICAFGTSGMPVGHEMHPLGGTGLVSKRATRSRANVVGFGAKDEGAF
jgi:hypothetical protein